MIYRISICLVCGHSFGDTSKFKPSIYCDTPCANYMKYKDALEKQITKILPTSEARKIIRGDMFRLSNLVSKRTLTIPPQNKGK